MILDILSNRSAYKIHPRLAKGLLWLDCVDLKKIEEGKHTIDGKKIFAIVQSYETKPAIKGRWEAHRTYTDIQYIIEGQEIIGWRPTLGMKVEERYNKKKDVLFLQGGLKDGNPLAMKSGYFAIFMPGDAHMPTLALGKPSFVKKVVLKIQL